MKKSHIALTPKLLKHAMPLPPELARLLTKEAEPWLQIDPDPAKGFLEGPAFDRQGNLYVTMGGPGASVLRILKITPKKGVKEIYSSTTVLPFGIAIHKDGRLFVACMSRQILIMNSDGSGVITKTQEYDGKSLFPNDLVFDAAGNLYVSDFQGFVPYPTGGVYRLLAPHYDTVQQVVGNLAGSNGVSLTPTGDALWVGETTRNAVLRVDLMPDGVTPRPYDGITYPYYSTGGPSGPDGNKVDEEGNLYQCMNFQGRAVVLNQFGVPVANVLIPGREKGKHLLTTNLAFKPGTNKAYIMASGEGGSWIYRFWGLARGLTLYSHQ
jgi:lactonase